MKVCPTCQSSYPDGFKYCPQDNSTLQTGEEYARRSQPVTAPAPTINEPAPEVVTLATPAKVIKETPRVSEPQSTPYIAPRDLEISAPTTAREAKRAEEEITRVAPSAAAAGTTNGAAKLTSDSDDIGLNLALPEAGSLFSRFIASFQNIKDVQFRGTKLAAGATQDFQVLIPDESLFSVRAAICGGAICCWPAQKWLLSATERFIFASRLWACWVRESPSCSMLSVLH
jgi:hypothetical protein